MHLTKSFFWACTLKKLFFLSMRLKKNNIFFNLTSCVMCCEAAWSLERHRMNLSVVNAGGWHPMTWLAARIIRFRRATDTHPRTNRKSVHACMDTKFSTRLDPNEWMTYQCRLSCSITNIVATIRNSNSKSPKPEIRIWWKIGDIFQVLDQFSITRHTSP